MREKIRKGYNRLEDIGVQAICLADIGVENLIILSKRIYSRAYSEFSKVCEFSEQNKKKLIAGFGTFCLVAIIGAMVISNYTVYEYMYDGKVLGTVKNQDKVYETVELVSDKLSLEHGVEVKIDKETDISFNKVIASSDELKDVDDEEDILNNFTYMQDTKIVGYTLQVEGEKIGIFDSEESIDKILDKVKAEALKDKEEKDFVRVGFQEDIEVVATDTRLANLDNPDDTFDYVMTGGKETKIHNVEIGDSMSVIASKYGITVQELKDMNPGVDPAALYVSQEIKLEQIVPLINVETTEIKTYKETVPYDIMYEDTDKTFKGQEFVQVEGANGSREVTAEITKCNGEETDRKELTATTIKAPITKEVLRGSRAASGPMAKGYFIYPNEGRLTSKFGPRWGRTHNGIDIAAATGTPIKAAAGGVVVTAESQKSFGNVVKISHGGGRYTLYAHCSMLFVKPGDQVLQGDHIANVGNTGNSTGPHCHFEVIIDGVSQNPMKYL